MTVGPRWARAAAADALNIRRLREPRRIVGRWWTGRGRRVRNKLRLSGGHFMGSSTLALAIAESQIDGSAAFESSRNARAA